MNTRRVTYTRLAITNGKDHAFRVYAATLHRADEPLQRQFLDLNEPDVIFLAANVHTGDYRRSCADLAPCIYLELARDHETPEAPAFCFCRIEPPNEGFGWTLKGDCAW